MGSFFKNIIKAAGESGDLGNVINVATRGGSLGDIINEAAQGGTLGTIVDAMTRRKKKAADDEEIEDEELVDGDEDAETAEEEVDSEGEEYDEEVADRRLRQCARQHPQWRQLRQPGQGCYQHHRTCWQCFRQEKRLTQTQLTQVSAQQKSDSVKPKHHKHHGKTYQYHNPHGQDWSVFCQCRR